MLPLPPNPGKPRIPLFIPALFLLTWVMAADLAMAQPLQLSQAQGNQAADSAQNAQTAEDQAQAGSGPGQSGQAPVAAQAVSQRRAVELARENFPGNVISISERRENNLLRYRIRMDDDGMIFTVYVEAATGAVSTE